MKLLKEDARQEIIAIDKKFRKYNDIKDTLANMEKIIETFLTNIEAS